MSISTAQTYMQRILEYTRIVTFIKQRSGGKKKQKREDKTWKTRTDDDPRRVNDVRMTIKTRIDSGGGGGGGGIHVFSSWNSK